jgi:hypothetical protein
MMLWPAVALIGFLLLTALVIAMGASSTARYERERDTAASLTGNVAVDLAAGEPVGASLA